MTNPTGGFSFQDLGMITTIGRRIHEARNARAKELIDRALPGQTLEEAGVTPEDYSRVYGKTAKPTDFVKPPNALQMLGEEFKKQYLLMPDTDPRKKIIRTNYLQTVSGAQATGKDTGESIASKAATEENESALGLRLSTGTTENRANTGITKSANDLIREQGQTPTLQTFADMSKRGQEVWTQLKEKDPVSADDAAFQLNFGKSVEGMKAQRFQDQLSATANELAIESYKSMSGKQDPKKPHPMQKVADTLGLPLPALYHMLATGGTGFLTAYSQVLYGRMSNNPETAIARAQASWAESFGKASGIDPVDVIKVSNRLRQQAAYAPDEVPAELQMPRAYVEAASMFKTYSTLQAKAAITAAQRAGDPSVLLVQQLAEVSKAFANNPQGQEIMSNEVRKSIAKLVAVQRGLVEPPLGSDRRKAYDAILKSTETELSGLDYGSFFTFFKTPGATQGQPVPEGEKNRLLLDYLRPQPKFEGFGGNQPNVPGTSPGVPNTPDMEKLTQLMQLFSQQIGIGGGGGPLRPPTPSVPQPPRVP